MTTSRLGIGRGAVCHRHIRCSRGCSSWTCRWKAGQSLESSEFGGPSYRSLQKLKQENHKYQTNLDFVVGFRPYRDKQGNAEAECINQMKWCYWVSQNPVPWRLLKPRNTSSSGLYDIRGIMVSTTGVPKGFFPLSILLGSINLLLSSFQTFSMKYMYFLNLSYLESCFIEISMP